MFRMISFRWPAAVAWLTKVRLQKLTASKMKQVPRTRNRRMEKHLLIGWRRRIHAEDWRGPFVGFWRKKRYTTVPCWHWLSRSITWLAFPQESYYSLTIFSEIKSFSCVWQKTKTEWRKNKAKCLPVPSLGEFNGAIQYGRYRKIVPVHGDIRQRFKKHTLDVVVADGANGCGAKRKKFR